ncbi:hypothetical protein Q8W30_15560 [Neptunomonas phycophila]|uniref:Phasin domain-containing protein n=1 Tax=Neptunomonas phycophila TaxID=1572645 RepID=A0ABT9EY96_9GAMM|nr:polyhydroxyalkanoate granule-associated phasin [Neptunomonas phycophila]MBT3145818.1 hypothetical protein [Neptunomonas phycophila]MDP2523989.1 hypothetical protein [Neptunomonas phycophila]
MSRNHQALPMQLFELAFAVPVVVNARVTKMMMSGGSPSAKDQKEFYRMGEEKVEAFFESWQAVSKVLFGFQQDFFRASLDVTRTATPFDPLDTYQAYQDATHKLATKGLAPIHRRAVSNAKRLG